MIIRVKRSSNNNVIKIKLIDIKRWKMENEVTDLNKQCLNEKIIVKREIFDETRFLNSRQYLNGELSLPKEEITHAFSGAELGNQSNVDTVFIKEELVENGCENIPRNQPKEPGFNKQQFYCCICKNWFADEIMFKTHMLLAHKKNVQYLCPKCGKSFKEDSNVNQHSCVTQSNQGPYTCSICGSSFKFQMFLHKHMLSHCSQPDTKSFVAESNVKQVTCSICGKSFKSNGILKQHMIVHSITRLHSCSCGSSFKRKADLSRHVVITHNNKNLFSCSICGKSCKYKHNLTRHLQCHSDQRLWCIYN